MEEKATDALEMAEKAHEEREEKESQKVKDKQVLNISSSSPFCCVQQLSSPIFCLKNLKKAEGLFREMGMDYWLDKTQEVLDTL